MKLQMETTVRDDTDSLLYSFEHVDLLSYQETVKIKNFQTVINENRYIFKSSKSKYVKYIILPQKPVEMRKDVEISDRNHKSLPLIPAEKANILYINMCKRMLDKTMEDIKGPELGERLQGITDTLKNNLESIFNDPQTCAEDIKTAFKDLKEISESEELTDKEKNIIESMLKLSTFLINYIGEKYYPLILLPPESCVENIILIDEKVKRIREFFWDGVSMKFGFFGQFDFPYEIEPKPRVSCDYNLITPDGVVMKDINFDFDDELKEHYNKRKDKYFDKDYFHFPLSEKESKDISKSQKKTITISFGLSPKGSGIGIFTTLIAALWLCILFPVWSTLLNFLLPDLIPKIELSGDVFFSILAISAPITVALAVYAMDKHILTYFIQTQTLFLILAFLFELAYFRTEIFSFLKEVFLMRFIPLFEIVTDFCNFFEQFLEFLSDFILAHFPECGIREILT